MKPMSVNNKHAARVRDGMYDGGNNIITRKMYFVKCMYDEKAALC